MSNDWYLKGGKYISCCEVNDWHLKGGKHIAREIKAPKVNKVGPKEHKKV